MCFEDFSGFSFVNHLKELLSHFCIQCFENFVLLHRGSFITDFQIYNAKTNMCIGVIRLDFYRLLIGLYRILETANFEISNAKIIVRLSVIRRGFYHLLKGLYCLLVTAKFAVSSAKIVVRIGR